MESNRLKNQKNKFFSGFLFFFTGIVTGIAGYIYGKEYIEIVHNLVTAMLGAGIVWFLTAYFDGIEGYDYDNGEHKMRFRLVFLACLPLSVVFPLIPSAGWPYLAVFVLLTLCSNLPLGMVSASLLLMITVFYSPAGRPSDFFMHFISGSAAAVLFQQLDESYKVGTRVFTALLVLFLSLSGGYVLFINETFSPQLFLLPMINLFVSLLLLLVVLKYFSVAVIHKYRDKYMDLNDPECPLLVRLKETDKEEYLHAVHTAYLCGKMADVLGLDHMLMRAGGYYHRIGSLLGANTWENVETISRENAFPPKLILLLREYNDKEEPVVSKEAAALVYADMVISVIRSMFRQDAQAKLDYSRLMGAIFKKIAESGKINVSRITMEEVDRIKRLFLEETLYYDFLR